MPLYLVWFLDKQGQMHLYTSVSSKHNPTTCRKCDWGLLYQQAILPLFFPSLSSQCNKSPLPNFWTAFEQTAWTDTCINILLQCSSDLTKLPLYFSDLKRQINLSAVFAFVLLFVAQTAKSSQTFSSFPHCFLWASVFHLSMLSCVVQITVFTI